MKCLIALSRNKIKYYWQSIITADYIKKAVLGWEINGVRQEGFKSRCLLIAQLKGEQQNKMSPEERQELCSKRARFLHGLEIARRARLNNIDN